jgi:hypothetical protein
MLEWTHRSRICASDGNQYEEFARDIALSGNGNLLMVGCHKQKTGGKLDSGAAYLYAVSGEYWVEVHKYVSVTPNNYDRMGQSISIPDVVDKIAIGVDGYNSSRGTVLMF